MAENIGNGAIELYPIGVVRNEMKAQKRTERQDDIDQKGRMELFRERGQKIKEMVSELVIDAQWEELLDGIEVFSHILVLYWPHLLAPEKRKLRKVHPMGVEEIPLQGIFATCSPARPNPVLVSAVSLLARKGNILEVKGLEAIDGSPIIDVKPYSRQYLQVEGLKAADWLEQMFKEMNI